MIPRDGTQRDLGHKNEPSLRAGGWCDNSMKGVRVNEKKYKPDKIQSTPDNSNLQEKSKKVRVIGSSKQVTENKEIRN